MPGDMSAHLAEGFHDRDGATQQVEILRPKGSQFTEPHAGIGSGENQSAVMGGRRPETPTGALSPKTVPLFCSSLLAIAGS